MERRKARRDMDACAQAAQSQLIGARNSQEVANCTLGEQESRAKGFESFRERALARRQFSTRWLFFGSLSTRASLCMEETREIHAKRSMAPIDSIDQEQVTEPMRPPKIPCGGGNRRFRSLAPVISHSLLFRFLDTIPVTRLSPRPITWIASHSTTPSSRL